MYYTIYKIVNKLDNKSYIGKHQTKDLNDGYMGSGKLIKAAIKKYGIENFEKQILYIFDNEAEMNAKEKELVDIVSESSYNLVEGGTGGFGYINRTGKNVNHPNRANSLKNLDKSTFKNWGWRKSPRKEEIQAKINKTKTGHVGYFKNKKHTDEAKLKMSKAKGTKITYNGVTYNSLSEARKATGKCFNELKRMQGSHLSLG